MFYIASRPALLACVCWFSITTTAVAQQLPDDQRTIYPDDPAESAFGSRYESSYAASTNYSTDLSSRSYQDAADSAVDSYRPDYSPQGKYRQPVAITVLDDRQALISTKLSGEIYRLWTSELDCELVFADPEASFGALAQLSDGIVVVADERQDELVVLEEGLPHWTVLARLSAPGSPNDLSWNAERKTLLATGKWSRRLYRWQLRSQPSENGATDFANWSPREAVDLPMCGGQCLVLPEHHAIMVADAFGRDYAMIDQERFAVTVAGKLYGHNITALAATQDEQFVFFPHQLLNEYARSVKNDITWGGLMSNNIRWLRTERLLYESGDAIFKRGKFYPLGTPGNGAGDPTSMSISSSGRLAITLGGTNRVAVDQTDDYYFRQAAVGLHPVDCAYSRDESRLFVVNQFSDSISIVDLQSFDVQHVALGPLRKPTQIEFGEQAFFNSRLGHDGWMSCQSCHSSGHTNGQLNDNFSDKSYGTPKRVLSLLGQAETMPYAWDGTVLELEDQVRNSIVSTMGGSQPEEDTVTAIAAYVRSLPPPPSVEAAREALPRTESANINAMVEHGRSLFRQLGCNDCHAGNRYTSDATYDVGLEDENQIRYFNPPSLISVSQRQGALLHDGRAKSLHDVLQVERHQLPDNIRPEDIHALVRFLESL